MNFRYRYVNYGTVFTAAAGIRDTAAAPDKLFENELIADVGGACLGYEGETRVILDHHFRRRLGQFPSASAAVLHRAAAIRARFTGASVPDTIWLVTHRDPDFDAFCALYLARGILSGDVLADGWEKFGLHPDGWLTSTSGRIDWFAPHLPGLTDDYRWPALLAAYASCVDNCRRTQVPQHRSLHAILYAGARRGRDWQCDGALGFFTEVREALARGLNPLCDSILEGSTRFAPELAFLDRELVAYQRDILRARQAWVMLPMAKTSFANWFDHVQSEPLFENDLDGALENGGVGAIRSVHEALHDVASEPVEGICLRDPECVLFKEWARHDRENSSGGQGFLFTAVAYSNARPEASANTSDYYFSIDYERAGGRHLYPLWARLQHAEMTALFRAGHTAIRDQIEISSRGPRPMYESRAGTFAKFFDDPWFAGENYDCTIIVTPNRGTLIGPPGTASDLSDDPVADIVRAQLEHGFFEGTAQITDFPSTLASPVPPQGQLHAKVPVVVRAEIPPFVTGCFRFVSVPLTAETSPHQGTAAAQIGRVLWSMLEPDVGGGVPADFSSRHLLRNPRWIAVWSRRGIAVAWPAGGKLAAGRLETQVRRMADFSLRFEKLVSITKTHGNPPHIKPEDAIFETDSLIHEVARLKHILAQPEGRVAARFLAATQLDELVPVLRDLTLAAVAQKQRQETADATRQMARLQRSAQVIETFIVFVYGAHLAHMVMDHPHAWGWTLGIGAAALVVVLVLEKCRHWLNRKSAH